MSQRNPSQQGGPIAPGPQATGAFPWVPLLALAVFTALLFALTPVLLPGVAQSISDTSVHAYWYISRASAFVAFVLLWISVLAGLGITSNLSRIWPGMLTSFELHRFTALLGLGFGLVHALVLLGDQYSNYTLAQLLIPFMGSNYRPEWVGFGQLSFYLLVVVAFTFYIRDRLGAYVWRLIHMLSFALFVMVVIHGLKSGTDAGSAPAIALYTISALSVAVFGAYRVLHHRDPAKDFRDATGLVIAAGRSQPRPTTEAEQDAQSRNSSSTPRRSDHDSQNPR